MCGLTGFWNFKGDVSREGSLEILGLMSKSIEHRGPDSNGCWMDEAVGIGFAHQRLAIVDLTATGHQPMVSRSGKSILVYNGEVFNTDDVRDELVAAGMSLKGQSDTEVILEGCELWGVEATCRKLIGMFAFAYWDRALRELTLVRDRLGIKPLYWGIQNDVLFFGSQLKSFLKHPACKPEMDQDALVSYFRYNYIPAPQTIYRQFHKLEPGHILKFSQKQDFQETVFWDLMHLEERKIADPLGELEFLLKDAVKRRMIADVPLGAFLSGGIDSATIVALMQSQSSRPIKTFSIGFHEEAYDETSQAESIAQHLKTEHTTWRISEQEARDVIPLLPSFYDEPFADVSQIPMYLVSKLAKSQVTVALSGDGGDELFGGYNRYRAARSWTQVKKIPLSVRRLGAGCIQNLSPDFLDKVSMLLPKKYREKRFGEKLHRLSNWFSAKDESDFYLRTISQWFDPEQAMLHGREKRRELNFQKSGSIKSMQQVDLLSYLPDDILVKLDRATMAVALEGRVPFLDHRVVEFAMSLPESCKFQKGKTKWLLRELLKKHVPEHLNTQEKLGFGVPIDVWLRGSLKEWAEELLSERSIKKKGLLDAQAIQKLWQKHLSREANFQHELWGVLMFQNWISESRNV
ncbi:MAG: asparagine synthase (glutamine-hydrolyzing) [Myxococcaceae bacterium]|nr:asparagine synthase (glutamine-hydrolyzing) [Myxococcaceae bacterium]MBH2006794.1 asparagine synthase (glutamine-hydrolyzing) [Myxococcaceae bacterium]